MAKRYGKPKDNAMGPLKPKPEWRRHLAAKKGEVQLYGLKVFYDPATNQVRYVGQPMHCPTPLMADVKDFLEREAVRCGLVMATYEAEQAARKAALAAAQPPGVNVEVVGQ